MKHIIRILLIWGFLYLCIAFVFADFNAFNWGIEEREGYVFLCIAVIPFYFVANSLIKDLL
jgi:hypothetical protein